MTLPAELPRGKAIKVRYCGPTNYRGSRWIATADLPAPMHRAIVSYAHELPEGLANARTAADVLLGRWNADYADRYQVPGPYRILAGGYDADAYYFIAG